MRVLCCSLCVLIVACGSDRFESVGEIGETGASAEATADSVETIREQDSGSPEKPVNVTVNVEVNVDGKPAGSASATNETTEPAQSDKTDAGGVVVITEELTPIPIPTSYVPREHDAGQESADGVETFDDVFRPVPAVVLDDSVASFREWFVVGYNFDSQRLDRELLDAGGYAAHATVTGNDDYTVVGTFFDGPHGEPRDAADFDGVAFWTCGDFGGMRFEVPTIATYEGAQHFGKQVDVTPQWQLTTVRWSDLRQDSPTHVFDVEAVRGLLFTVVVENYELWLSNVQFWTDGEVPVGPSGSCQ